MIGRNAGGEGILLRRGKPQGKGRRGKLSLRRHSGRIEGLHIRKEGEDGVINLRQHIFLQMKRREGEPFHRLEGKETLFP